MAVDIGATHRGALLVCDAAALAAPVPFAAALGLETLRLEEAEKEKLAGDSRLVIDVDVHDIDTVRRLRRLLSETSRADRIFVLRDGTGDRAGRVQAEALGATQVIARGDAMRQLLRGGILPKLAPEAEGEAASDPSIRQANGALARLFDGLIDDQPASLEEVAKVGSAVLEGVAAAGSPTEWLEEVRAHHQGTFQHCLLVAGVAAAFAAATRLGAAASATLMSAAILHDIGKAGIPLHILDKPGRLDPAELSVMRRHPQLGHDHLVKQGGVAPQVLDAVLHHHELLDGSGYPDGLVDHQIRPLTRVLTICDIFAALVEQRPYKTTRTPEEAIGILLDMARAGQVDMVLVQRLAVAMRVEAGSLERDSGYRRR